MNKDILNNTQMLIHRSPKRFDKYYTGGDFFDSQMSLKSKGLLGHLLKKPHNWRIYVSQLVKVLPEGKDAIYSSIRELVKYGHVIKTQLKDERGFMKGILYTVFEDPIKDLESSPEVQENKGFQPQAENPETVNSQLQIESYKQEEDNNCYYFENEENAIEETEKSIKAESSIDEPTQEKPDQAEPASLKAQELPLEDFKAVSSPTVEVWPSNEKPERKNEYLLKHCLSQKYLVETTLGKTLTPTQQAIVGDVAATFTGGGAGGARELSDWLSQTLLNPKAFSRSGESFIHKLNAMITKLRIGAYTRPYAMRYAAKAAEGAVDANALKQQPKQNDVLKERLKARAWENIQSDKGMDYADNRSDGNADLIKDLNRQLARVNEMLKKKISQLERDSLNVLAQNLQMRKQQFAVSNFKQGRGI